MTHTSATYRLPDTNIAHQIVCDDDPIVITHLSQLNTLSGFVFAPFHSSPSCPTILIPAHRHTSFPLTEVRPTSPGASSVASQTATNDRRDAYTATFKKFKETVDSKRFAKLVLSRTTTVNVRESIEYDTLFKQACQLYPHLFIALVTSPTTGTWLMATPELLLNAAGSNMTTIALAGTMRRESTPPTWSPKNQREQQIVADYITQTLSAVATGITASKPDNLYAANLVHLCTRFAFTPKTAMGVGDIAGALHPTPAVCGMPPDEARQFILTTETDDREYYSGFAGPLNIDGKSDLYVSLRCMKINGCQLKLYAGGGIMTESTEENEWEETEAKMETMKRLLGNV